VVGRSLLSLGGDAGANDAVFASPRGGHLTERAVNYMLVRQPMQGSIPSSRRTGSATPTPATPSIAALPCRWCNRLSVTATSRSRQAICTRVLAPRADYRSILGVFLQRGWGL